MKDHPSKGVGEISKVLSAEWSNMSEEDKAQYVRMSEEDKVRYQKVSCMLIVTNRCSANSAQDINKFIILKKGVLFEVFFTRTALKRPFKTSIYYLQLVPDCLSYRHL